MRGLHRGPVNSPHKWPVTRKMSPFDDVIMESFTWGRQGKTKTNIKIMIKAEIIQQMIKKHKKNLKNIITTSSYFICYFMCSFHSHFRKEFTYSYWCSNGYILLFYSYLVWLMIEWSWVMLPHHRSGLQYIYIVYLGHGVAGSTVITKMCIPIHTLHRYWNTTMTTK